MKPEKYLRNHFNLLGLILLSVVCLTAIPAFGDPSLVGWWKFDEVSGTAANDSSDYNNNGTVYGGATWTTGQIDGALNFDGSNDYVSVPDNDNSLDMDNEMTITAWIKPSNISSYYCIAAKQPSGTAGNNYPGNYEFRIAQTSGLLQLWHQGTGTTYGYTGYVSTTAVTAGVWQHVTVTLKEGDSVKFYINGAPAGTLSQTAVFGIVNNEPVRIGARKDSAYWFYGSMDNIRIYNRALSGTEIQQLYYYNAILQATNPTPADGKYCVEPNIILTWYSGNGALSHDVYFGTDYSDVNNADINDANVFMGNQDVNSWDPGVLNTATYFWRIDENSSYGINKGNIWSFTITSPCKTGVPFLLMANIVWNRI
ncbi:MAG: LamG domain-containing protein [Phycisphaerae bacterium]|jgi:hypothetical protein